MKYDILKKHIFPVVAAIVIGFCTPAFAISKPQVANAIVPKIKYATKIPMGRKQLALKFLLAMFGVGVSSVVIYVGLSVYNKLMYGGNPKRDENYNTEDDSYKTPANMKDALTVFLKKTK